MTTAILLILAVAAGYLCGHRGGVMTTAPLIILAVAAGYLCGHADATTRSNPHAR
jgi:hypothetical protein